MGLTDTIDISYITNILNLQDHINLLKIYDIYFWKNKNDQLFQESLSMKTELIENNLDREIK